MAPENTRHNVYIVPDIKSEIDKRAEKAGLAVDAYVRGVLGEHLRSTSKPSSVVAPAIRSRHRAGPVATEAIKVTLDPTKRKHFDLLAHVAGVNLATLMAGVLGKHVRGA
jgi:hypothetical protein